MSKPGAGALTLATTSQGIHMISRRSVLLSALATVLVPLPALARSSFSDAAFKSATASGRPVLIEFHADWCPTCRAQEKVVNTLVGQPAYSNVLVLRVLYDSQKDLLKRFGVRRQSTLILYKDGNEVGRAVGVTSSSGIASLLKKAA
jgi:thioredoxin 1